MGSSRRVLGGAGACVLAALAWLAWSLWPREPVAAALAPLVTSESSAPVEPAAADELASAREDAPESARGAIAESAASVPLDVPWSFSKDALDEPLSGDLVLSGRAVGEQGEPLPLAAIAVTLELEGHPAVAAPVPEIRADREARFEVRVPRNAVRPSAMLRLRAPESDAQDGARYPVDPNYPNPLGLGDVPIRARQRLLCAGRLVLSPGFTWSLLRWSARLDGESVEVVQYPLDPNLRQVRWVQKGTDGFELYSYVPARRVEIQLESAHLALERPVECECGARELVLVLKPMGAILGSFTVGASVSADALSATYRRLGPPEPGPWKRARLSSFGIAAERLLLSGLLPGRYELALESANAPGSLRRLSEVEVRAGETTVLDPLDLEAELAERSLRLVDDAGELRDGWLLLDLPLAEPARLQGARSLLGPALPLRAWAWSPGHRAREFLLDEERTELRLETGPRLRVHGIEPAADVASALRLALRPLELADPAAARFLAQMEFERACSAADCVFELPCAGRYELSIAALSAPNASDASTESAAQGTRDAGAPPPAAWRQTIEISERGGSFELPSALRAPAR